MEAAAQGLNFNRISDRSSSSMTFHVLGILEGEARVRVGFPYHGFLETGTWLSDSRRSSAS